MLGGPFFAVKYISGSGGNGHDAVVGNDEYVHGRQDQPHSLRRIDMMHIYSADLLRVVAVHVSIKCYAPRKSAVARAVYDLHGTSGPASSPPVHSTSKLRPTSTCEEPQPL
jgi:hypothetical protein